MTMSNHIWSLVYTD